MVSVLSIASSFNPHEIVQGLSKSAGQETIEKMEEILAGVLPHSQTPLTRVSLGR